MFFYVVGTHTKCIINDFAPAPRIDICIIQCHTVTHGTDLRKSPPRDSSFLDVCQLNSQWNKFLERVFCEE